MTLAMTLAYAAALAGAFGLIIGSFLNVVAYRLPRGESVVFPASHCPSCDTPIKPYDNVPVLSWLVLRGRCRSCHNSISARYPIVEAVTAACSSRSCSTKGADEDAWLGLAFVILLVPVTLIDLDHRIIPNTLMLIGTVVSVAILLLTDPGALTEHLIAAAAAGGFLLIAALAIPGRHGHGRRQARGRHGPLPGAQRRPRDARRARRRIRRRRGSSSPARARRRVARRPSRSAPIWLSAASSGCSPATRSSTGTSTPSSDLKARRRAADKPQRDAVGQCPS